MKKVLGVILLILSWYCIWAALFGFSVVVASPPALQQSGDATRLFIYCCLSLLCGVLFASGGIVLKKRWRATARFDLYRHGPRHGARGIPIGDRWTLNTGEPDGSHGPGNYPVGYYQRCCGYYCCRFSKIC